jgi:hypothetical protein
MVKIRELRWETGNLTYEKIRRDILSAKEKDYISSYNEILSDYCTAIDLDLTSSMEAILAPCSIDISPQQYCVYSSFIPP